MACLWSVHPGRRAGWLLGIAFTTTLAVLSANHWWELRPAQASANTLSVSGPDQLGFGLQDVYQIQLSDPAPVGGLAVTIDSNEDTCVVAPTENTQGDANAIVVVVAQNRKRADFVVQSTGGVAGTCTVTASASGWAGAADNIDVVQPKLRLRDLVRRIGPQAPREPFFVDIGVPNGSAHGLRFVQGLAKGSLPLSVQVCSDAPGTGTIVNRFGQDVGNDGCETNPVTAPFARTVPGDFQFDPVSGNATDANVTASAPGFISDSRAVSVRALAVSIHGPDELGIGLQDTYTVVLSEAPASDLNVTISVNDTAYCGVAPSDQSYASNTLTRTIKSGHTRADFVLQGVAATPAGTPCSVTADATASGYGTDTAEIAIVPPALQIRELASAVGQYAPNDPFFVELGLAGAHGRGLRRVQEWRKGLVGESPAPTPLPVTCTSDSPGTGTIVNAQGVDQGADGSETDSVPPGFSRTVPGNLAFDALLGSTTPVLVTCSAPGFTADDRDVLVPVAALQLTGPDLLGSRLQDDYKVNLQAAGGHASVDVTITSLTPTLCLVGPTAHTAPSVAITRTIGADESSADFVVNALDDLTPGQLCQLQATAAGYTSDTFSSTILQPGIEIRQLHSNYSQNSPNDPFVVFVGVPSTNGKDLRLTQRLRQGTVDLPIKACSDHPSAGRILDELNIDNPPASDDPPGYSCEDDTVLQAYASNVPGAFQFDPVGPGSTTVCVTATGFLTTGTGCNDINVGGDSIRLITKPLLGAGLQESAEVRLTKPAGVGGATVTITADAYCLLSASDSVAGSAAPLNVTIPEGSNSASFVVSALESLDGVSCTLTATATAYLSDTATIDIQVPGLQIVELARRTGTTAADDTFKVQIGVPNGGHLRFIQAVRIGGVAVNVTVCSSDGTIGTIVGATGSCQTKPINPGSSEAEFVFHVIGNAGSTKITVTGPGGSMDMLTVRVALTSIRLDGRDLLGKNLQDSYHVDVNNSGGLTVSVTATGDPAGACIVSASALVVGSGMQTFVIPAGSKRADFTVQALATGTCTLTATAPGVPTDTLTITIVEPRLRIVGLQQTVSTQASSDPFFVEIGPANPRLDEVQSNRDNRMAIAYAQPRYIGAGNLTVNVCSSVANAGQIKDPDNGVMAACADAIIYPGYSRTLDFEFDPNSAASPPNDVTDVTATAAGVQQTFVTVTVTAAGMQIRGSDIIGAGLQDDYDISLGHAASSGGVDVTVYAAPATRCKVASIGGTPQSTIVLHVEQGDRSAQFLLLGLLADPLYPCTITATAPGYRNASTDVTVVPPALHISSLDKSLSVFDASEPFIVETGARPSDDAKRFVQQAVQAATVITACVDNTTYAEIIGGTASADPKCRYTTLAAGFAQTGIFSLKPKAEGTVVVTVSAPGFTSDSVTVVISAASVRITLPDQLGAGLETHASIRLGHKAPTNITLHVCVAAGSVGRCEVAARENNNGANCVDIPVDQNKSLADLWVQAVESQMGECALQVDAGAGYNLGTASTEIVEPAFDIQQLSGRQSTLDANDPFIVRIGVPDQHLRHVANEQELRYNTRAGAVLYVPVVVCSTDTNVGEVVGAAADSVDPTHCRKGQIGQLSSRTSEFSFDPKNNGDTIVYAREVNGYTPTDDATVPVSVSDANLRINGVDELGVGLQDDYHVVLGKKAPVGGVDVTIKTLTPLTCQVARDRLAANQNEITPHPVIAEGNTRADFEVRGLATGECVLQASAAAFRTVTKSVEVEPDALAIHALDRSLTTGNAPDRFTVEIGVPDSGLRHVKTDQELSAVGSGQLIEACSSVTTVGTISGGNAHPDPLKTNCRSATIPAGASSTDVFSFVIVGLGDTVVSVGCIDATGLPSPNCVPIDDSTIPVHVSQAGIVIHGPDDVGAGLEDEYTAVLGSPAPAGGVTVTINVDTPVRCKVSAGLVGPAYDTVQVVVAEGHNRADFVVQGVMHQSGDCSITASAPGYSSTADFIEIDPSALAIHGLDQTVSAVGRNDPFRVDVGAARENLSCIRSCQPVAIDGGITATVCSSDTTYGVVVGGSAGPVGCRNVVIPEGQCSNDLLSFDPVAAGVTVVYATSPAVDVHVDCDTVPVTVRNAALNLNGPDELGIDLQDNYNANFSSAPPVGTTVTVTRYGSCVVSATREGPPTASPLVLTVPAGRSRVDFWVEALYPGGECTITATTNASGYNSDSLTISVETAAAEINGLDTSRAVGSTDEPFSVDIGLATNNLHSVSPQQEVRPTSAAYPLQFINSLYGVPLKVCSSNTAVGTIVGGAADGDPKCRQTTIEQLHDGTDVFSFHAAGLGTTTVCVVEDGAALVPVETACREVTVALKSIDINGRSRLGAGLMDSYTLALSAAVAADTTITVCSLDDTVCRVAPNATTASTTCASVPVPKGKSRADFYIHGLYGVTGVCDITATPPAGSAYASGSTEIEIVIPGMRIVNLDPSRSTQSSDDPFNLEIGVPAGNLNTLSYAQVARYGGGGFSVKVCSTYYVTVGSIVGADSLTGCKAVTIAAGASRTADSLFHAIGQGTTTVYIDPNGAAVVITDAGSKDVVVSATVVDLHGADTLGAGLEDQYSIQTSSSVAADTTFTVTSTTPSLCKLSVNRTDVGVSSIALTIPKGRSRAYLYLHGMDAVTGLCDLTITPPVGSSVSAGTGEVLIVQSALRISQLPGSLKTAGGDVPFIVEVGVPTGSLKGLSRVQERRAGGSNWDIYVCSSDDLIAKIVVGGVADKCRYVPVTANNSQTLPNAVAARPLAAGNATISAVHPDLISTDAASKDITVSQGALSISGVDAVGASLQDTFTVNASPKAAADLPITLQSLTPTLCFVAKDEATLGGATYSTTILKGHSTLKFAIQALDAVTGICTVRVSTTNVTYAGDDFNVPIVQSGLRIRGLDVSTTSTASNDDFFVDVGVPRDNLSDLRRVQTVRKGLTSGLTVTACSSLTGVGTIIGTGTDPSCRTATIAAGDSATTSGSLKFDPAGVGTTVVSATIPNFITTDQGSLDVYVAPSALSFVDTNADRVGSGLMETFKVQASSSVSIATSVHITSLSPLVCLVAVDELTAAAAAVDVTIPAGSRTKTFEIHGLENAQGSCQLRATSGSYADGFATYDIIQPAIRIDGLPSSKKTTASDDNFYADVGIAKSSLSNLQTTQKVRFGSAGVTVTICSSDTVVGEIVRLGASGACQSVVLAAGQSRTPTDTTNTFKFRPKGNGTTVVDAAAAGYLVTDAGTVDVTVTGNALSIESTSTYPVGAGLQQGTYYVLRDGGTSGITATVTVLTPTLCKVAPNGSTAGATSIALSIAANATQATFWVQGMEGVVGACQLQVSASGYGTGSGAVDIVRPAIRLTNLATSMVPTAANDPFNVEIGIADSTQASLAITQTVRFGSGGFDITVTNENALAGQLTGSNASNVAVSGQSVTVRILAGQFTNTTGALQRLEFDANDAASGVQGTNVESSNPNVLSTTAASQDVVVSSGGGC